MGPLEAISLAASILQFIEFTTKLINKGREIRDSATGATIEHLDLEAVAQSLFLLTQNISSNDDTVSSRGPSGSLTDDTLHSLVYSCQNVSEDLLQALDQLKAPSATKKWTSFVQALKTIWAKEKIQSLQERLEQYRMGIHTALLVSLKGEIGNIATHIKKLQSGNDIDKLKIHVLQAVRSAQRRNTDDRLILRLLSSMTLKERDWFMQTRILEHLTFSDQPEREHRIAEAHARTFRWIWTDPNDKPWSNFTAWLEEDDDKLYWITGKAGSGKSTLMKYIVHEDLCDNSLKTWAGDLSLIVTKFYFWNSGSQDQMSQEGLLRTVLHDALSQRPQIIPRVLPKRWQRSQLFGSDLRHWELSELEQAFRALVQSADGHFKLCLFVDGLDEFDGDHDLLIQLFRMAISFPNVKACLSSRPWVVFEEAFHREPSLRLEDITFPDIVAFVDSHLTANSGYRALTRREPGFSSELTIDIARRSAGVFLWVTLVVKSLLAGLSNFDCISDLQRRLDEFPSDLGDFYQKIFDSIEPRYVKRASEFFRLVDASRGKLTALGLSFADEDDSKIQKLAMEASVCPLDTQERLDRHEHTRRQLNSRCKGFLEIPVIDYEAMDLSEDEEGNRPTPEAPPPEIRKVTYLHRTVRDFLQSPGIKDTISKNSVNFDPSLSLFCSTLLVVKAWEGSYKRWSPLVGLSTHALQYASTSTVINPSLLDELDRTMTYHYRNIPAAFSGDSTRTGNWVKAWNPAERSARSFLELTSSYRLNFYIDLKMKEGLEIFTDQHELPLLYRVIVQYREYPSFQEPESPNEVEPVPDAKLVQHLLQTGTNPNHQIGDQTIWGHALHTCVSLARRPLGANRSKAKRDDLGVVLQYWLEIVKIFVESGADPRMNRNSPQGSCIRQAFGAHFPEEARRLEKRLSRKRKAWSATGRFILPPTSSTKASTVYPTIPMPLLNRLSKVRIHNEMWFEGKWGGTSRETPEEAEASKETLKKRGCRTWNIFETSNRTDES